MKTRTAPPLALPVFALTVVCLAVFADAATAQRTERTKPGGVENTQQMDGGSGPRSLKMPPKGQPDAAAARPAPAPATPASPPAASRPAAKATPSAK